MFDKIKKEYHEGLWERCYPGECKLRKEADIEGMEKKEATRNPYPTDS